jgi:competence protein ComEC
LVAVPLNVLLALLLVGSLLSGLVLCCLWWFPPAAWLAGLMCGWMLWLIHLCVWVGDRVPGGHLWLPSPPLWWLVVFYGVALGGAGWVLWRPRWRLVLASVLAGWLALGLSPWVLGTRGHGPEWVRSVCGRIDWLAGIEPVGDENYFRATFVDVGHGTSVMLELPDGRIMLYDAGQLGSAERSHEGIAGVLWHARTARIDRLFISHADSDHYNAVEGLNARFTIGEVLAPPQFWASRSPGAGHMIERIRSAGVPCVELEAGTTLDAGAVQMEVLHPPRDWKDANDNGDSLTLLVTVAGRRLLLPGDLERGGMRRLLSLEPVACDVVMAPHHGSLSHAPEEWLQWCQPKWVVISGGSRADREVVKQRYAPAGGEVAVTHALGAIQVRITARGELSLWHWNERQWQPLRSGRAPGEE